MGANLGNGRGISSALAVAGLCALLGCSDSGADDGSGAAALAPSHAAGDSSGAAEPRTPGNRAGEGPLGAPTQSPTDGAGAEMGGAPTAPADPSTDPPALPGDPADGDAPVQPPTGSPGSPSDGGADGDDSASEPAPTGTEALPDDTLCEVGVYDGTPPKVLDLSGDTFAHDPTLIEANGQYYRFWTGPGIPMATSSDLVTWRNGPSVYGSGQPDWARTWLAGVPGQTFNFPWAPDVSYFGGRYHLYSSFSAKFGDNISCITHLTSDDIAGGDWTDHGPVICTEGDERYNAIDADVGLDEEGNPYLSFGSFWDGIMAFPLDREGNRVGDDLVRLAWAREIEAPVMFRRCGYYYLFVTWGLCCPGENRQVSQLSYRVAVGRSKEILGPYLDREGRSLLDGGGTLLVEGNDEFAAAGHSDVFVSGDRIYHTYHAYRLPRGNAELRIVEMPFDEEGWPVAAGP